MFATATKSIQRQQSRIDGLTFNASDGVCTNGLRE